MHNLCAGRGGDSSHFPSFPNSLICNWQFIAAWLWHFLPGILAVKVIKSPARVFSTRKSSPSGENPAMSSGETETLTRQKRPGQKRPDNQADVLGRHKLFTRQKRPLPFPPPIWEICLTTVRLAKMSFSRPVQFTGCDPPGETHVLRGATFTEI